MRKLKEFLGGKSDSVASDWQPRRKPSISQPAGDMRVIFEKSARLAKVLEPTTTTGSGGSHSNATVNEITENEHLISLGDPDGVSKHFLSIPNLLRSVSGSPIEPILKEELNRASYRFLYDENASTGEPLATRQVAVRLIISEYPDFLHPTQGRSKPQQSSPSASKSPRRSTQNIDSDGSFHIGTPHGSSFHSSTSFKDGDSLSKSYSGSSFQFMERVPSADSSTDWLSLSIPETIDDTQTISDDALGLLSPLQGGVDTPFDYNAHRFLSPFMSNFPASKRFGYVHCGIAIGPYYFEWNNSSLCVPKICLQGAAIMVSSAESIGNVQLFPALTTVSKLVAQWNMRQAFHENNCNCMHFVEEVLSAIKISRPFHYDSPDFPMGDMLKQLKQRGRQEMNFRVTEAIFYSKDIDLSRISAGTNSPASPAKHRSPIRESGGSSGSSSDSPTVRLLVSHQDVISFARLLDPAKFERECAFLRRYDVLFWVRSLCDAENPRFRPPSESSNPKIDLLFSNPFTVERLVNIRLF